eukprot:TRINITY_DN12185_c0_g1_i1.p1 TRINITY_DN12185_c0_g1~~TRINITY_DN12185_c0_g1_i1.p1  ORF type:complete len:122 (-),score=22.14 TRINITY_DN12185_c0_g1_i1:5-370(-)
MMRGSVLLLCLFYVVACFDHSRYCGKISNAFKAVDVTVRVFEPKTLRIKTSLEINDLFTIYKRKDTRIWIPVCTKTGWLCKEDYEIHDLGDKIRIWIDFPIYKGGVVEGYLENCPEEKKDL